MTAVQIAHAGPSHVGPLVGRAAVAGADTEVTGFAQPPRFTGAVIRRRARTTLPATISPVLGLSGLGTFWTRISIRPKAPSAVTSWVLCSTPGSAMTTVVVRSKPRPAMHTIATTLTFAGKRFTPSRAGPS